MLNFDFYAPTQIFFGKGKIEVLGKQISQYTKKILFLYGKGSIKRNGIYDVIIAQLHKHGISFIELAGVDPNPRLATVREGANLCRKHGLEFILAVGGGSVIDCAKGIAAATLYDGDPWDFWTPKARVTKALPIGTVLTIAAAGSEMNNGSVVTNEETQEKKGTGSWALFPKFSILDPTYTFSVSPLQTAAGVVDIMTHVYEFYFSPVKTGFLQDVFAEAILKTCVKYGSIAYKEPENYEARANLMWAGSMALNGVAAEGKTFDGFNHLIEHAVSGIYDLAHGVGLAILAPYWMEYVLDEETVGKLVSFAKNVWNVEEAGDFDIARKGIQKTKEFYGGLGLPNHFSQVGIGTDRFDEVIRKSMRGDTLGQFKKLTQQDILSILMKAK